MPVSRKAFSSSCSPFSTLLMIILFFIVGMIGVTCFFSSSSCRLGVLRRACERLSDRAMAYSYKYREDDRRVLAQALDLVLVNDHLDGRLEVIAHSVDQIAVVLQVLPFEHVSQLFNPRTLSFDPKLMSTSLINCCSIEGTLFSSSTAGRELKC